MIGIDEAIKRLTEVWRYEHTEKYTGEEIREAIDLAIDTLKQKEWLINEYEHEVDLLEQDIEDDKLHRIFNSTKLAVYDRVLRDLKGDGEDC